MSRSNSGIVKTARAFAVFIAHIERIALADDPVVSYKCGYRLEHYSDALLQPYMSAGASAYQTWSPKRKAEFLAGRICATRCLKALGNQEVRIAFADDRSPIWPNGFVGSISHTEAVAIGAVTRRSDALGVGIDIQNIVSEETASEVSRYVLRSDERELTRTHLFPFERYLTVVFAAKESIYKAVYPILKAFFDFSAVRLVALSDTRLRFELVETLSGRFQAGSHFDVRYRISAGVVLTWVCLPAG